MNPTLQEDRATKDDSSVRPGAVSESDRPAPYVYILSSGGSGSTLLELLLGGHPDIEPMGEAAMLGLQIHRKGPFRCSCGKSPLECPVWSHVIDAVRTQFDVDLADKPFRFRVSDLGLEEDHGVWALRHWLLHTYYRAWRYAAYRPVPWLCHLAFLSLFHRTWVRNRLFVADEFRRITHAKVVIDSSKDYIGLRDLCAFARDPIKTVFLTRDVRGVVWTTLRRGMGAGKRADLHSATNRWLKSTARSYRVLNGLDPRDWIHLKYEDLCVDLEAATRRLCAFVGLRFDPAMLELVPREHHTIGGSRIRYTGITRIEESLAWQENLSRDDLRKIADVAGPLAGQLGYNL